VCNLDYNQLKRVVLRALAETGSTDSSTLLEKLISAGSGEFDIHAVRMALVRYYRQGLLTRDRADGRFSYALSSRGAARLRWLEEQLKVSQ
jgi:DNA-binding transcriptional regulator PaaX